MMVKEIRYIFDLTDVKALRLRCGHCGREAVQSIETTEVPKTCPFCNDEWEVDLSQGSRGWNHALVANMQRILKEHPSKMTIRFEIDGEDKRD